MASPDLDIEQVKARADAVLAEPLYWFPVRHHSPGVARHLRAALLARKPKLILIEGPPEATALVKHVVDARTKPPVALYSSYRDDENVLGRNGLDSAAADIPARFASWYPLLAYSPEYVAMKVARELDAEVVFIDLPHRALLRTATQLGLSPPSEGEERAPDEEEYAEEDEEDEEEAEEKPLQRSGWEALALESTFYKTLARVAGYRSWSECWDALFEVGGRHPDHESFRRDLAYFCASVRATTTAERIASDGTLERERHMLRSIEGALAERKLSREEAMVVCGGFHLFLDRDDRAAPPEPPRGTVYSTVAPYSAFGFSELSGYGAGNRAPRYYELLFEHSQRGDAQQGAVDAMVQHVVAVLTRGRKEAEGLSSADAISVTQHARMLGTLRGRTSPTLDDIRDALISCCCKGRPEEEGAHLLAAMAAVEEGNAVGRVTPELGRLPLLHDFYAQLDALDLGEVMGREKRLKLTLDLRDEQGARRSVFLHRMLQLGVPFGVLTDSAAAAGGSTLFREQWTLSFTPKIEPELIEKNLYGDTVEAAAIASLDEELAKDEGHAGRTCERLLKAFSMELPGVSARVEIAAGAAIDTDRRFGSLAQALTQLLMLDRLAGHRKLRRDVLADLITRCFGRACFVVPEVASVPEEEQAGVISGLQSVAEVLLGEKGEILDRALFAQGVHAAFATSTSPYLKGAFSGILTEIRVQPAEALAAQVAAYSRERPEVMITAGEFLDGLLAVSKTSIMLGADALLGALDELLRAAEWEQFVTMLPRVRNAFERLHERQRRSLADRVAQRYGLKDGDQIATLTTSAEAALEMARIDARVAAIMKDWSF